MGELGADAGGAVLRAVDSPPCKKGSADRGSRLKQKEKPSRARPAKKGGKLTLS